MPTKEEILKAINEQSQIAKIPFEPVQPKKVGLFDVLKEVPTGISKTAEGLASGVTKFIKSTAEVPETLFKGGKTPTVTREALNKIPLFRGQESFIEKAERKIPEWQDPTKTTNLQAAMGVYGLGGEIGLAGLETAIGAKALFGDKYLTSAPKLALKVPTWVAREGEIVLESGGKAGEVTSGLIDKFTAWAKEKGSEISQVKQIRQQAKATQKVAKQLGEPISKREKIGAFEKAGKQGGVMQKGKLFKRWDYEPDYQDFANAQEAVGSKAVNPKKNVLQNLTQINKTLDTKAKKIGTVLKNSDNLTNVERFSLIDPKNPMLAGTNPALEPGMSEQLDEIRKIKGQKAVDQILENLGWKENSKPMNLIDLNSQIDGINPSLGTKSESSLQRVFDNVKTAAKEIIGNAKGKYDLWQKRIEFDQMLEKEFGDAIWDTEKPTHGAIKDATSKIRTIWNKYIGSVTPEAGNDFQNELRSMTKLYDVRGRFGEKYYKLVGSDWFKRFILEHPNIVKTIQGGGFTGAGYVGYRLFKKLMQE